MGGIEACRKKIKNSTSELMKRRFRFGSNNLRRSMLGRAEKFAKIDEQTIGGDNFTSASITCRCSIGAEQALDLRVSSRAIIPGRARS